MLINMRNAMLSGGKLSAKSYVQDGLVAMWDGIENAGWGVHDPNATVWKNLSGSGYDMDFHGAGSTKVWGEDGFHFQNWSGTGPYFLSKSLTILKGLSSVTFSICLDVRPSTGFGTLASFRRSSANNRLLWYRQTDGHIDPVVSTVTSGTKHLSSTYPYTKDNTNEETITVDPSGGIVFYINGAPYAMNSVSDFSTIVNMDSALGFNREGSFGNSGVGGGWKLRRCCLYSRALTAAEIAANYAIDKARFNLPDAT